MPDYRKLYYRLFAGIDRVLQELEEQNYGRAKELLIELEQEAEERFLNDEEFYAE